MLIQGKVVQVYDLEIFPNVFHCTIKNTETGQYEFLEISERRNDLIRIVELFWTVDSPYCPVSPYIFCGYNVLHYDKPIINYIIDQCGKMQYKNWLEITQSIYNLSNEIIGSKDNNFSSWSKWKYATYFPSLDLLTMLYSQKLRVGLKELQVTMQYHNVQEYEGNFQSFLPKEEIENMILYNINDVDSSEVLLNRCKKDIDLRIAIEEEYKIPALNKDGVNLGMDIIAKRYCDETGLTWKQIKDLRSPCDYINLNEIILPFIEFKTPILKQVLEEMKSQTVSPGRKGYEKHFLLDELEYCVGVGGIHSVNKPEKIIPKKDEIISDVDVALTHWRK